MQDGLQVAWCGGILFPNENGVFGGQYGGSNERLGLAIRAELGD